MRMRKVRKKRTMRKRTTIRSRGAGWQGEEYEEKDESNYRNGDRRGYEAEKGDQQTQSEEMSTKIPSICADLRLGKRCTLKVASGLLFPQKQFRRCFSQVLRKSGSKLNISSRQLQRCVRIMQRNINTDQKVASEVIKAATEVSSTAPKDINYIPAPPKAPSEIVAPEFADISESLNALGEPTLKSLGLGSYYPSGIVQQILEFLHVSCDLPWYASIASLTLIVRVIIFPLFVKQQKINTRMQNHFPTLQKMMEKQKECELRGDHVGKYKYMSESLDYRKKHKIGINSMLTPLVQAPIFMSVFFGTRAMAELPIQSMKTGGIFWFTDLTLPDPYFGLPLITSATLLTIIHIGAEGQPPETMNRVIKGMMYGMPVVMFLFIQSFPTAMLCYWTTNNALSLIQAYFFKKQAVRRFFDIPDKIIHPKKNKPKESFSVTKAYKDAKQKVKESKVKYTMVERERMNAELFRKSGEGPISQTYHYDPTKVSKPKKLKLKGS
ncbi:hypothetical protein FSP39_020597 [Pinctada imbricata]|uniref:Membrane insertase YidC/Oxa/ALB C-terminal domain-containing protein n=1 Tax=Pinctada imbricata TaxID=66713 RepID=A0AA88XJS7_PINIB|nr:hypothetical protein FSP39_020597 [Pinctada imbricata]